MNEGEQGPFPPKLRVRIKDNNSSPHGKFYRFLFPFSSKLSDLNLALYVLYRVSLGYLCSTLQGSARLRLSGNKNKLGDRMIKQLLISVTAKYRDLSVSRRSIICLSLRLRQIIDLLAQIIVLHVWHGF